MWRQLSPRGRIAAGVLVAILIAAIGYTAGLLTPRHDTPGEGSPEVGFARDMSAHHAQAVEMGMIAYQSASTPDVRTLGGDIAITQQGQVGIMQTWLKDWGVGPNGTEPPMSWMPDGQRALDGNLMPGMATREEVAKLKAATGKDADILFLQYMLRHHLGGIHMVDGVLAENPSPQVKELAETMKKNQSGEVTVMENMLSKLGARPLN
jgi:uncharacterized protein (DUF305 family)